MNKALRRHAWALPLELIMAGGAVVTASQGNWKHCAASSFTVVMSLALLYGEKLFRVVIPPLMHFVYVAFIFASLFAGEVLHMYSRIWVWDDIMHFASSFLIGTLTMFWLLTLKRRHKTFSIPAWFGAIYVLGVAVTAAVMWEIIEFASDQLFGTYSQGADLPDTMMDLVYETASGLIIAVAWVAYIKGRYVILLSPILKRFERLNP